MNRGPLDDYYQWQRKARRRRIAEAALGWALVVLAVIGGVFILWLGMIALIVVAS